MNSPWKMTALEGYCFIHAFWSCGELLKTPQSLPLSFCQPYVALNCDSVTPRISLKKFSLTIVCLGCVGVGPGFGVVVGIIVGSIGWFKQTVIMR